MSYRPIYIRQAYKLSYELGSLLINKEENHQLRLPLEDINIIILEDSKTILTSRLISELSKRGISLIVCDEKHLPNTFTYPINSHHKILEVFNKQINLSNDKKRFLWQQIIECKIKNQALVIDYTSKDKDAINILNNYIVKENDYDNREGIAAKVFFTSLYGSAYIRSEDDVINHALDYGYTILLGEIIRNLCSYGFCTYLGIWHDSKTNNFNLASDLIEPFRPIVDYYVYWRKDEFTDPLSSKTRQDLIKLLDAMVNVDNKNCTVKYAIELLILSLIKVLDNKANLMLPKIIVSDFTTI